MQVTTQTGLSLVDVSRLLGNHCKPMDECGYMAEASRWGDLPDCMVCGGSQRIHEDMTNVNNDLVQKSRFSLIIIPRQNECNPQ